MHDLKISNSKVSIHYNIGINKFGLEVFFIRNGVKYFDGAWKHRGGCKASCYRTLLKENERLTVVKV